MKGLDHRAEPCIGSMLGYFRSWHFCDMPMHSECVCLAVKTGSDHDKFSAEGILTLHLATG
jgi:hypothetical protein